MKSLPGKDGYYKEVPTAKYIPYYKKCLLFGSKHTVPDYLLR